jgi:putative lipoic acid-binding regulatory protein
MGLANDEFESLVVVLINKHVPDLGEGAITSTLSKNKKYMSITATIQAKSQEQLDALYRDLTKEPRILMVL